MKRLQKLGYIAIGAVLAATIMFSTSALAADAIRTLTAHFTSGGNPISIFVDGAKITPKDANGNIVEPFVVDGTTYLPVRAVGEALGKTVTWDGATASVYVGERPGTTQYMTDICPAYESTTNRYKEYSAIKSGGADSFSMGGVKYLNGFIFSNYTAYAGTTWAVWNLNGNYQSFTATLGHIDGSGSDGYSAKKENLKFDIFCDGVLRDTFYIKDDMLPKTVSVDLTGVMQLKIVPSGFNSFNYGFGNPVLS